MQTSDSAARLHTSEDWSAIEDDEATAAPATVSSTTVENEVHPGAIRSIQREDDLKLLGQGRGTGGL
jgi:hypothetical protein